MSDEFCNEKRYGWLCSLEKDHDGCHVSRVTGKVIRNWATQTLRVWPTETQSTEARSEGEK